MVKTLKSLGLNYIAVVYTDDQYGKEGAESLRKLAESNDICIPVFKSVLADRADILTVKQIMQDALIKPIRVFIFFGKGQRANEFLSLVNSKYSRYNFTFIFSESLQLSENILRDSNNVAFDVARGSLLVAPMYHVVEEFQSYWSSLISNGTEIMQLSKENNWLIEVACTPISPNNCDSMDQSIFVYYAIQAAYAMAHVLKEEYMSTCDGQDVCESFFTTPKGYFTGRMANMIIEFNKAFPTAPRVLRNSSLQFQLHNDVVVPETAPIYGVYNYKPCSARGFCLEKVLY